MSSATLFKMAVSRPARLLCVKEWTAVAVASVRCQSGLPAVKTSDINNTLQLHSAQVPGDNGRPLVVLFGWMLAKKRHLNKYGNLYLSKGFDVISMQVPPSQVLWPLSAQKCVNSLLHTLKDSSLAHRPLLIHGFSVGGYLYGEMLLKLENEPQKYSSISERMIGQVFDSPVDYEGVPRGFANVLSSSKVLQTAIRSSIESYLQLMPSTVTKHYIQSSGAFHRNFLHLPSLFLYSQADPIGVADIIEGVMDKWKSQGLAVSHKCWDHSPHVSHFHHHPDEYVETLLTFLDTLGLSTPEHHEGEREKEVFQPVFQQVRGQHRK